MASDRNGLNEPVVFRIFLHPLRTAVFALLMAGLMVVISICVNVAWFRDDPRAGAERVGQLIVDGLEQTTVTGEVTPTTQFTARAAIAVSGSLAHFFRFSDSLERPEEDVPVTERPYQRVLAQNAGYVVLGIQSVKLLVVRAMLVVTSLPVLLFGTVLGTVDGLVARAIRRMNAGRESSNLYHRAKQLHWVGLTGLVSMFLVVPVRLDPVWIFLPYAAWAAVLSRVQWKYYKKYF